jgi:hypothetical protein
MHHLLITCHISKQVWHEKLSWLRLTCRPLEDEASLCDWWIKARQATPKSMHKSLASAMLLTAWMVWKQRNACIFDKDQPSVPLLVERIRAAVALWAKAGAPGQSDHPSNLGHPINSVTNDVSNLLGGLYPASIQRKETEFFCIFSEKNVHFKM